MRNYFWLTLFVLIIFAACSMRPVISPTETIPASQAAPTDAQATRTSMPTKTPVPTFDIVNIQPVESVIDLSKQTLKQTTRILVYEPELRQLFSITSSEKKIIPIDDNASVHFRDILLSPNHQWFAYTIIDKNGFYVVVSSVDGSKNYVMPEEMAGYSFQWIDNNNILIYDSDDTSLSCPGEVQIYKPFLQKVDHLPNIPATEPGTCLPIVVFNPGINAVIIQTESNWIVYDYEKEAYKKILPGLKKSFPVGRFYWSTNGISFMASGENEVYYVLNIPDEEIENEVSVNVLRYPSKTRRIDSFGFDYWDPEHQLAGVDLVNIDGGNVLECDVSQTFVILNFDKHALINYCLDRYDYQGLPTDSTQADPSEDARFVGWTNRNFESDSNINTAVIMDTETGAISYIEGYEFIGFGEVLQEK